MSFKIINFSGDQVQNGDPLPGLCWCRIFKFGTQHAHRIFVMTFSRIFSWKKCHQQFVSTFGCQGCSPTSLRDASRKCPNSLFCWPANGLSAEKKGVLGVGASARVIQEALGGKTSFGFEKKTFSQKYCIRSVWEGFASRSLKTKTEMCVLGKLQKLICLDGKAPICYIYSAFGKTFFLNSKTDVPAQAPTKRNSKFQGAQNHHKFQALSEYAFGNSNFVSVKLEKTRWKI